MNHLRKLLEKNQKLVIGFFLFLLLIVLIEVAFSILLKTPAVLYYRAFMAPRAGNITRENTKYEIPSSYSSLIPVNPDSARVVLDPAAVRYQSSKSCKFIQKFRQVLPAPSSVCERDAFYTPTKQLIQKTVASFDVNGLRDSPRRRSKQKHYAVFLGDSFTFGEGLSNDQTLPYQFELDAPEFNSYNLAFSNQTPADILDRSAGEDFRKIVKEGPGIFFYMLHGDQLKKLVGSMSFVANAGVNQKNLHVVDGVVVNRGLFHSTQPRWVKYSKLIMRSATMRFFAFDYPLTVRSQDLSLFTQVIHQIRWTLQKSTPGSRFIVVILPDVPYANQLRKNFEGRELAYIDYSQMNLAKYSQGAAYQAYTGHYSAAGVSTLARQLSVDMRAWNDRLGLK